MSEEAQTNLENQKSDSEFSSKLAPTEYDDLRAAAEEALKADGEQGDTKPRQKEATDDVPSQETKPKAEEKAAEEGNEDNEFASLPKLAAVIRAREKAQKIREESESVKAEMARQQAEIQSMLEQAKREREELAAEKAKLARLKQSPIDAIKELGWSTDDLVQNVVNDGKPEWQQIRKLSSENEELKSKLETILQKLEGGEKSRQEEEQRRQAAVMQERRTQVVQQFLTEFASEDKCPSLHALYEAEEIIAKADQAADAYYAKTKKVAPLGEVAEYLEYMAKERLAKLQGKQPAADKGNAPKPKAGSRTLSSSSASERRASPKPVSELTRDEEREALIAEAEEARRAHR